MKPSQTKILQNRSQYITSTDYDSLQHFKKCDFVLKLSRGKFKKTSDRALLSQSAKAELRKQRIVLIMNELKNK